MKVTIVRANLAIGEPSSFDPPGSVDATQPEDILAPPNRFLSSIRDFAPIRMVLLRDPRERGLAIYAREYLVRYRELVRRYVTREGRAAFAFQGAGGWGVRVVCSTTRGSAVIFDPRRGDRLSVSRTEDEVETAVWPSANKPWGGPPTTFRIEPDELVVFVPGKAIFAGKGSRFQFKGGVIYEGRMVLKGRDGEDIWSTSAAGFDALYTFLRGVREVIADEVARHAVEGRATLDIQARAIALVRAAESKREDIGDPWASYEEYFRIAHAMGIDSQVAHLRLDDIIREMAAPDRRERFMERLVIPVLQNLIADVIFAVAGGVWAGLASHSIQRGVVAGVIVLAGLLAVRWLIRR